MLGSRHRGQSDYAEVRWPNRERLAGCFFGSGRNRSCLFRPDSSRRNSMALAVGFTHQFEQMMIVDRLDLIGQDYKKSIDFIELATVKVITKLFTPQT